MKQVKVPWLFYVNAERGVVRPVQVFVNGQKMEHAVSCLSVFGFGYARCYLGPYVRAILGDGFMTKMHFGRITIGGGSD